MFSFSPVSKCVSLKNSLNYNSSQKTILVYINFNDVIEDFVMNSDEFILKLIFRMKSSHLLLIIL